MNLFGIKQEMLDYEQKKTQVNSGKLFWKLVIIYGVRGAH